jgi:hypothetical protein
LVTEISWTEMAAETVRAVESFAANETVLALFAGAVLALHQDTLRASAIDMARADDSGQVAALDAARSSPLGDYASRLRVTLDALRQIESANRGFLAQAVPAEGDNQRVAVALARLRLCAARLWLLTLQARAGDQGGAGLRIGVAGLWTRLQTMPREAIGEGANTFAGTFYNGVRSSPIDLAVWPLNP